MPLLKKINTKNYTIGIWKVKKSECEQFIDNHLYPNYHPEFIKFKNLKRKWQVLAVKLLFKELCNKNELISKNGIPYIKEGNRHVSISHTKDIIVLIIANFPCGIDIEDMNRDATKVKDKFINKKDTYCNGSKMEILKIWCMKEVLYKIKKDPTLLFKEHLHIEEKNIQYLGNCNHPDRNFKCNLEVLNFKNYFLAFNIDYSMVHL